MTREHFYRIHNYVVKNVKNISSLLNHPCVKKTASKIISHCHSKISYILSFTYEKKVPKDKIILYE